MRIGARPVVVGLLIGSTALISVKADQIDDYVSAQMRQLHIPGLSLAIVRDGLISKAQGYGFANRELSALATKETVYEIGSNTKQFTAAAIMLLVEDGKVRLDDGITKYFPKHQKRGAISQFVICSATLPAFKIMSLFRTGWMFSEQI